jgi:predicted aldo/keto reductase-like oxidoreductase
MKYRTFGNLDWKPSVLGFGAMRLPIIDKDPGRIDEPEAIRMLRYAFDHGVNYVDTAYPYHRGTSEIVVGKALKDGYREKVRLATKLPTWLIKTPEDFDKYFAEQLKRLQTDYIDFYLLHALDEEKWSNMQEKNVFDWAEKKMDENQIMYLGFSFHDSYELFTRIISSYKWAFCQIQYNYMDEDYQAGTKGLQYAAQRGLAVVVMEPIRGGRLADPPPSIAALWDAAKNKRTAADWALQWVWNHPEVSLLLSGMSTMEQVKQNIESANKSGTRVLTTDEIALIGKVRDKYQELCPIPCTKCEYCLPCPNGVKIPRIFEIYNDGIMYDKPEIARRSYQFLGDEERADSCIQCGNCEELCPQSIEIMDWLAKVHQFLCEDEE